MRITALLGLVLAGHPGFAHAAGVPPEKPPDIRMLEKVTVSGVRPGPGLWKVSKGDHTLWILGLVSPIPKKMEWYSPQSEARLRHTQELIGQPQFGATMGWGGAFKMAFAMPTILRARKNPDGKTLRDVLPADLYARWLPLKAQYLRGDKSIEEWRPLFAAAKLYDEAVHSAGLENGNRIRTHVYSLADKYRIRKTSATISFEVTDPKGLAKSITKTNADETACFRSVLDQLDSDIAHAAERANAWAVGNMPELARLVRRDRVDSCLEAFMKVEAVREMGMQDAMPRAEQKWLAAVDGALAANETTFSMLPMKELLASDGLLSRLKAKGYVVEAPE